MFVKRRKFANLNNNELLENKNHPYSKITKICLQHRFNCDGNSKEVQDRFSNCQLFDSLMTHILDFCCSSSALKDPRR